MKKDNEAVDGASTDSEKPTRKGNRKKTANALAPLEKMLPGVVKNASALVIATERRELYNHITVGYVEAAKRIRAYRSVSTPEQLVGRMLMAHRGSQQLAAVTEDALESVRKQFGLDKLREELLEKLKRMISVEHGTRILERTLSQLIGSPVSGLAHIFEIVPHITTAEIALLPLLKRVPRGFLSYGTELTLPDEIDEEKEGAERRIPQFYLATTSSLSVILDCYNPQFFMKGLTDEDVYDSLGLTGIREHEECVPFNSIVHAIIRQLVPLVLSNNRLYRSVWNESTEAMQIALGRIARRCVEEAVGVEDLDLDKIPIDVAIESLTPTQKALYDKRRMELEKSVATAAVMDLGQDRVLNPMEVFRLVGMLAHIPSVFLEKTPFQGYSLPYGAAVRFIDENGNVLDQVGFHPTYARNAIQTLNYESIDDSIENQTVQQIFEVVRQEVNDQILGRLGESQLGAASEECATKLWLERGIALSLSGGYEMFDADALPGGITRFGISTTHRRVRILKKIGTEETEMISAALSMLPSTLLEGISRVRKLYHYPSLRERMCDVVTLGEFEPEQRRIVLMETADTLFADAVSAQKFGLMFTLLHECGENIWAKLPEKDKARWEAISWPSTSKQKAAKHFLTWYSRTDEKEDFCEHFAAYVAHGREFRLRAETTRAFKRKYLFIGELFKAHTGDERHFKGTSKSIRDIHGALRQRRKKLSLKRALEYEQAMADAHEAKIRQKYADKRADIDDLIAQEEAEARAQEEFEGAYTKARRKLDDWKAIEAFIATGGVRSKVSIDVAEAKTLSDYTRLRDSVVAILRKLPKTEGQILKVAIRVIPAIIQNREEELEETLSFVPKAKRKKAVKNLLELRSIIEE